MKRRTGGKALQASLALTLAVIPAAADAIVEVEGEEIVVSATKTEKVLQEVPSTVSLVNAEESAGYGNNSIADMVRDVPGVEIFDNSIAGSKRLMIRGENGGRVIVLIDGQKINEQKSMDGAPLLIDPATVERIEVVKGAGSVLYGSEAIGGVVNIITKKGGDRPIQATASTIYSSGTKGYEGSLGLYGSSGGLQYRLTGSYSDQGDRKTPDGTLKGSDSMMKNISGFLGYANERVETGLTLDKYEVEADVPPLRMGGGLFDLNLPEWSRQKAGAFVDIKDVCDFVPKVHFDGYYQQTVKDFRQYMDIPMPPMGAGGGGRPPGRELVRQGHPGGQPGGHPGAGAPPMMIGSRLNTDNDQETYAVNTQIDMVPSEMHYLISGVAFSYDTLDSTTKNSFTVPFIPANSFFHEAAISTWALYLQDEWSLTDAVTLTLGVRETWVESELEKTNDRNAKTGTVTDSHPAFSAGLTWNAVDDLSLRGLFSQGYRFPDLGKLFIGTTHGGAVTMANQDLDPETSNNFELGARFDNDHLKTDVALFYTLAENYINAKDIGPGYKRYENVDEAETVGAEMWIGYRFEPFNLTPYLNGTLMGRQYEDSAFTTWKTNTPLFSGRTGLRFEQPLAAMPVTVWGDLYLRMATKAEEEAANGLVTTNDSWNTFNLAVGTKWGENDSWQASINLNNIFDESYTTAQNSLEEEGFNVVARLALSF